MTTPPLEADIPGELRSIAERYDMPVLRTAADAVEIEQAYTKRLHDVAAEVVRWAPWPDEQAGKYWDAMRLLRKLVK